MITRPHIHLALCVIAHLTTVTLFAAEPGSQQTVAFVNDQPITAAEVTRQTPAADRSTEEARKATLEKLIDKALLLQAFKKMGNALPLNFAKEKIQSIVKEEFQGDEAKFEAELKRQGFTLESFERTQAEMIVEQEMRHDIAKAETSLAAKKQAVATWLATERAKANIIYE